MTAGGAKAEVHERALLPLSLIVLFGFFSIGIPLAVYPAHVHGTLGFGNFWVGVVLGLQSLATLLTRHHSGTVADLEGAKLAVQRGIMLTATAGIVSLLSIPLESILSLSVLLASRVVLGLGESLLITGALAWGVGLLGPARAGRVMAYSGMAMYAAIAAAAPLGLFLARRYGIAAAMAAAIVLPLIAGLLTFFVPAVQPMGKERMPFYTVLNRVWKQGAGLAFSAVGFAGVAGFGVLYFQQQGWQNAALLMPVFGAAYILSRLMFAQAPDRFGGKKVALVSLAVEIAGLALIWLAPSPVFAFAGAALTGFGYSLAFPSFGVEAVKSVEPQFKGVALGAYVAFFDLALGTTGPLAGLVANGFGYAAVYLFGLVSCGVAILIALQLRNKS